MIFEGSDGAFGSILVMEAGWDQLVLEQARYFLFKFLGFRCETLGFEQSDGLVVGGQVLFLCAILQGINMDEELLS
jgi:hypothetical protein